MVATLSSSTKTLVAGPDIISRGFVYVREAEDLIDHVRSVARNSIEHCMNGKAVDWTTVKNSVKSSISRYIYEKTNRSPMILPIIMEV